MSWSLITAPDEEERCCVVIDGSRCEQPTVFRIEGADRAWDDYTFVCRGHLALVKQPGYLVIEVARPTTATPGVDRDATDD